MWERISQFDRNESSRIGSFETIELCYGSYCMQFSTVETGGMQEVQRKGEVYRRPHAAYFGKRSGTLGSDYPGLQRRSGVSVFFNRSCPELYGECARPSEYMNFILELITVATVVQDLVPDGIFSLSEPGAFDN